MNDVHVVVAVCVLVRSDGPVHYMAHPFESNQTMYLCKYKVTQSRCIMLDSILLFFILAAVLATLRMQNLGRDGKSFTASWWAWLLTAGGALGCACKWQSVSVWQRSTLPERAIHYARSSVRKAHLQARNPFCKALLRRR